MAAAGDVCAGLIRHKLTLLRELCDTHILDVLVKKGLFSFSDHELITGASDYDKCNYFVEVVSKQSGAKLNELCSVLERECPKLSKELMNDRQRFIVNGYSAADSAKENMVMNHNLNRESPRSRRSVSQCSCNSRRSSIAASPAPAPLPPLNNTMEMYVEPVVEDVTQEIPRKQSHHSEKQSMCCFVIENDQHLKESLFAVPVHHCGDEITRSFTSFTDISRWSTRLAESLADGLERSMKSPIPVKLTSKLHSNKL